MKKTLFVIFALFWIIDSYAQIDSLADFDYVHFNEHLSEIKDNAVRANYLKNAQRNYLKRKYDLIQEKTYTSAAIATSTCGNFDFEDGNVAGWTMSGDFQIMSGSGVDPFGGFPVVADGVFSLRLNDNNTACSGPSKKVNFSSSASRWITVTSSNCIFKINWAGVVLNFPHPKNSAANIKIQFFDASNNVISGLSDTILYASPPNSVVATFPFAYGYSNILGAQICSTIGTYSVSYFPWQQQIYNLSSYIGQTVKLNLSADWCLFDYDWAYAYFDLCCDSTCKLSIVNSSTINSSSCFTSPSTTLCSSTPTNVNFQWYDSSGPIGTSTCISVFSSGMYTLTSSPPSSSSYTVNEIFSVMPTPIPSFSVNSMYCSGSTPVNLVGSPSGGYFTGIGISGNVLYPGSMGTGSITIYYTYTDPITNCFGTVTQTTTIANCTGLNENERVIDFNLSPNPFSSEISISCYYLSDNLDFVLYSVIGEKILQEPLMDGKNTIETEGLPKGLYFYSIEQRNKPIKQGKLVKE